MATKQENLVIAVLGSGVVGPEIYDLALQIGRLLAERGAIIVCGGLGGVMEAACRGAKEKGGITIGILPGTSRWDANPYVDYAVVTGMQDARNVIIVRTADAAIAVDGEYGTLSEIAFCLKLGVPVVSLAGWSFDPAIRVASTPEEAVEVALSLAQSRRRRENAWRSA
ncbi:MAG: TIGR00725 family protein [candidate division KSB1 bacterium]|nr:TIGR00725 family protein [candidate division KSB1 bacterium]